MEREGKMNMLNDGSCIMPNNEPEEPGLEVTTPKSTLPFCDPYFGDEFIGWTQSKATVRVSEPKRNELERLQSE